MDGIKSLVVCVEYDDFLSVTLPRNKRHFDRTLVVTSTADKATQELARKEGCECLATDAFYGGEAWFNKGAALEEAFGVLGRQGWFCIWDADIVMPETIEGNYDPKFLYGPKYRLLEDVPSFSDSLDWSNLPLKPKDHEYPGHFQLFHASGAGDMPWYSMDWIHAGGCDSDFEKRYVLGPNGDRRRRPTFQVLHLGFVCKGINKGQTSRVGPNWCGRTTPRLDTKAIPSEASERSEHVEALTQRRRKLRSLALQWEKISGSSTRKFLMKDNVQDLTTIPKRMSLIWTGRMSWLRWMSLYSFIKFNPDWEVRLYEPNTPTIPKHWTMNTDDDHEYQGKDYRDQIPSSVSFHKFSPPMPMASPQMCGWLRWQVLATTGGFFADMDFIWVKPLEEIWEQVKKADAMFCLEGAYMAVGLMASKPECKMFQDMALSLPVRKTDDYQHYGVSGWVYPFAGVKGEGLKASNNPGPTALQKLSRHYSVNGRGVPLEIARVPDETVYPLDWREVDHIWKSNREVNPKSLAIHWFGGNHLSRKFSHELMEDNWQDTNNTITNYLRKALG